jgi:type III pantothenate kinase
MSTSEKPFVIVDAGNTSIKVAQVKNSRIKRVQRFGHISEAISSIPGADIVCASVLSEDFQQIVSENGGSLHQITYQSLLPFKSAYRSMKTIGIDRLCNVAGALKSFKGKNCLIIDIGTCIKFDLISESNVYLGGSISPGIDLRYKALNEHTSQLPLLDLKLNAPIIGEDTKGSMHSGVINGLLHEIEGMISRYEKDFEDLKILITGGDASYFDFPQKSNIFANKNLTLEGIVEIYEINAF